MILSRVYKACATFFFQAEDGIRGHCVTGVQTCALPIFPEGARSNAVLDALPGKKPLIKLSYRPPNYETPLEYFRTAITPNDAFFVRYHLSNKIGRASCRERV